MRPVPKTLNMRSALGVMTVRRPRVHPFGNLIATFLKRKYAQMVPPVGVGALHFLEGGIPVILDSMHDRSCMTIDSRTPDNAETEHVGFSPTGQTCFLAGGEATGMLGLEHKFRAKKRSHS